MLPTCSAAPRLVPRRLAALTEPALVTRNVGLWNARGTPGERPQSALRTADCSRAALTSACAGFRPAYFASSCRGLIVRQLRAAVVVGRAARDVRELPVRSVYARC